MFKGLRTKIESEQKGQSNQIKPTSRQGLGLVSGPGGNQGSSPLAQVQSAPTKSASNYISKNDSPPRDTKSDSGPNHESTKAAAATTTTNLSRDSKLTEASIKNSSSANISGKNRTVEELESQILQLQERLQTVIGERHLDVDQNAQSNELIATLQKNINQEKAAKSALETKLHDIESKLKEKTDNINNKSTTLSNAFIKSFNPDGHNANITDAGSSDDVGVLRQDILNLQAQLAKKNRQLKISQQNLTDMKRSLQKEILEHSKTQDELVKLQKQIKNQEQDTTNKTGNDVPTHNGSNGSNPDKQSSDTTNQASGDKYQETGQNFSEDAVSLNAGLGNSSQFDRVSCMSRSSASVDDLDANDLQNNHNKEVSHEYLKNVLFRYMTSTDVETTQHLVKAISVLMDFTPEQSAAIKSAMSGKTSSWLRLK